MGVMLAMGLLSGCATKPVATDVLEPFAASGDAIRGREVFLSRDSGHCVLCHAVPGEKVAGDVGPSLVGVGARLSPGQIRLRVADISRVNPGAAMPSFHRLDGLTRVASNYAGKPVLNAQQVEDLVSWLGTLR